MVIAQEMPKYKCHKEVWALKISAIEIHPDKSATIAPANDGYAPFKTISGWAEKFKGSEDDPGYYIVYKGGYSSWSPTREFEEGYTRINSSNTSGAIQSSMTNNDSLAHELYDTYCEAVCGKDFNGDPLPKSSEFFIDPTKEKQSKAWLAVSSKAFSYFKINLKPTV